MTLKKYIKSKLDESFEKIRQVDESPYEDYKANDGKQIKEITYAEIKILKEISDICIGRGRF